MSGSSDHASPTSGEPSVPPAVVSRLSLYLRELQHLLRDGHATTNSTQLGALLGFTDAQVRKDLAYFGQFGYPGVGYRCDELMAAIRQILGTDRPWNVAVVGLGNLGRALLRYKGFDEQGFRMVAAFDVDAEKLGEHVEGIAVYHVDQMAEVIRNAGIRLGIIAVPAPAAQQAANALVAAGIEGILNFAPVTLALPSHISRIGVDLAIQLEQLAFAVVNRPEKP